MSMRRVILADVDLVSEVSGHGAQFGNELFLCQAATRAGWAVRYDPDLVVVHHAAARTDGTARAAVFSEQLRADVCNMVLASLLYAAGTRRVMVPLYTALVGERTRPGVLVGLSLAVVRRDRRYGMAAVQTVAGVADAVRKRPQLHRR